CKRAVPVIVIENVLPELRDVKIGEPVVVIISPDTTKAVTSPGNTGLLSHVGEGAVAVVLIQRILCGDSTVIQIAAVHEINVLPAIAVEIGDTNTWPKNLADDGNALGSRIVHKLDS